MFIREYHSIESDDERIEIASRLTEAQRAAFRKVLDDNLILRKTKDRPSTFEKVEVFEPESTGQQFQSEERDDSDDITPLVDGRYADSVTAYVTGTRVYTWEHEIAFTYDHFQVVYQRSWMRGQSHHSAYSYNGWTGYKDVQYHAQQVVTVETEGKFTEAGLVSYKPRIKLKADANGGTGTPYKDDGYPVRGS